MKPFPCVEDTIDVTYGTTTVRLWINRPSKDIIKLWMDLDGPYIEIKNKLATYPPLDELINWLVTLPNVNAVQVMEKYEDVVLGTVVYTVPFENDVHG